MKPIALLTTAFVMIASSAFAEMQVKLVAPWDGVKVPDGEQCTLFGGQGSTPGFDITGLPAGTTQVNVEFNDKSYSPLANDGGHGIIGFSVSGESATLPPMPGLTTDLPDGVMVVKAARSTGQYASPGYLPPCSGGRGNRYTATIKALSANGDVLDLVIDLGIGVY